MSPPFLRTRTRTCWSRQVLDSQRGSSPVELGYTRPSQSLLSLSFARVTAEGCPSTLLSLSLSLPTVASREILWGRAFCCDGDFLGRRDSPTARHVHEDMNVQALQAARAM